MVKLGDCLSSMPIVPCMKSLCTSRFIIAGALSWHSPCVMCILKVIYRYWEGILLSLAISHLHIIETLRVSSSCLPECYLDFSFCMPAFSLFVRNDWARTFCLLRTYTQFYFCEQKVKSCVAFFFWLDCHWVFTVRRYLTQANCRIIHSLLVCAYC